MNGANDNGWAVRPPNPANAWNAYNPYGRQTHKMSGAGRRNDILMTSQDRLSLRRLRGAVRRFWPAWLPSRSTSGDLTGSRPDGSEMASGMPSASTVRFILLCSLWYTTSALSSNTGKVILSQFRYPVTLTIVQFAFVAFYCLIAMSPLVRFTRLRLPNKAIFRTTLPVGAFQVGGHMFSSMAISRISVSTVHTIKALSPLFTVAAYALLFGVSYSAKTYISLIPLTLGVMLACTFDMSGSSSVGLLCAFGSALVFVSSNIFFKKIMPSTEKGAPSQTTAHKLDKVNLLFYSSSMAFVLMVPIWLWSDLPALAWGVDTAAAHVAHPKHGHEAPHSLAWYFFMNGTVHFLQNLIAFVILSNTSPVTYSIASLIKRVAVICIAIVWFSQRVHPVQGLGILLTFAGLWLYNNAKGDVAQGEKKVLKVERARDLVLPSTKAELAAQGDAPDDLPAGAPLPPFAQQHPAVAVATGSSPHAGPPRGGRRQSVSSRAGAGAPPPPPPRLAMDGFAIPGASPSATSPYSPGYAHHRGHQPNLHIQITPPTAPASAVTPAAAHKNGRTHSYPSPPLSLDSPPESARLPIDVR